jgi:hypothetical protein
VGLTIKGRHLLLLPPPPFYFSQVTTFQKRKRKKNGKDETSLETECGRPLSTLPQRGVMHVRRAFVSSLLH